MTLRQIAIHSAWHYDEYMRRTTVSWLARMMVCRPAKTESSHTNGDFAWQRSVELSIFSDICLDGKSFQHQAPFWYRRRLINVKTWFNWIKADTDANTNDVQWSVDRQVVPGYLFTFKH